MGFDGNERADYLAKEGKMKDPESAKVEPMTNGHLAALHI